MSPRLGHVVPEIGRWRPAKPATSGGNLIKGGG
jgi:hypothetical protein